MAGKSKQDDEMRSHYDFSEGVRGKYAARYAEGTNAVMLAPDVAEVFRDSIAVNGALRTYLDMAKQIAGAGSATDAMAQLAASLGSPTHLGGANRDLAEAMTKATNPFGVDSAAYAEIAKKITGIGTATDSMTQLAATLRGTLDFGDQERKLAEAMTQGTNPFGVDSAAYAEIAKQIAGTSTATDAMTQLAATLRGTFDLGDQDRKLAELLAQASKPIAIESLADFSAAFAEARKPLNFPGGGDLSAQLAAHTLYLDPSRFRTPSLSEDVATKVSGPVAFSSVLDWPLGEIYVTEGERKLQKEISGLRTELSRKTKALARKEADAEAQAAAANQRDEKLIEAQQKETLLYILSRINQDAGRVLLASDALQSHFRDEGPLEAYVMSVDIRRSTDLMLKARSAKAYAGFITGLCNVLKEIVIAHHGVFDKFTGDGILAFFPKFYTGEDAGLRAVLAAADCHAAFTVHYEHHRNTFVAVAKGVGLGIGIDRGDVHLVQVADGLTVVGTPVVYACRMGATPAGTTLLNHPAYEEIFSRYADNCALVETEFDVKHEGPVLAYGVVANEKAKAFEFPDPAWKNFRQ